MKNFETIFNKFMKNETGSTKRDSDSVYVATKNALLIRSYGKYSKMKEYVLAYRINNNTLGNSSLLRIDKNQGQITNEQTFLSDKLPMIPFNALKDAELSLSEYQEIDSGIQETIYQRFTQDFALTNLDKLESQENIKIIKKGMPFYNWDKKELVKVIYDKGQHFMGARLFKIKERVFLLDVDRNELEHGIINPFMVEIINKDVSSISEAYESLKPQEVKEAKEFKRQGEWFFIPNTNPALDAILTAKLNQASVKRGELRAGRNRPNLVESFIEHDGIAFVKGVVTHSGREHKDLDLGSTWHKAMPNTSTMSWTITGDLD